MNDAPLSTTTVRFCQKCGARVRFADDESVVRCQACNEMVPLVPVAAAGKSGGAGNRGLQIVVGGAFTALALVGVSTVLLMRRTAHPPPPPVANHAPPPPTTPVHAPLPIASVAADAIAWEPEARPALLASFAGDATEDLVGFFRAWDGRSAWVSYAGAFDGGTLKPLWRSEPLDPWLIRKVGIVPTVVVAGQRVVIADTSDTLRVYALATGEKLATYRLEGVAKDLCKPPDNSARVWVRLGASRDALIDLDTGKPTITPRPAWCPPPTDAVIGADAGASDQRAFADCHDGLRNVYPHAACVPSDRTPKADAFEARYALKDGPVLVALGTATDPPRNPVAIRFTPAGGVAWRRDLLADATTSAKPEAPHQAELADGRAYVVYEKIYFDSRLVALDAKSGEVQWDVALVDSLGRPRAPGRGDARAIFASPSRVYVARAGGGLDVFDARNGAIIGTIGK